MNKRSMKVDNTSNYWFYHSEQDKAWWFFKNFNHSKSVVYFYESYFKLTKKYQILNCVNNFSSNSVVENLSFYYTRFNKELLFPTRLFIQTNCEIEEALITDVNELNRLIDVRDDSKQYNEVLRIVEFGKKDNNINDIFLHIKNDVFFMTLLNEKTYISDNECIKKYGIDNSELAYLNTPRFNSFFRDLKKLCLSYGAEFSYEIDIYNTEDLVSSDGILINKEIIYYEDIVDLLDEKYRIVDLSINTNFN